MAGPFYSFFVIKNELNRYIKWEHFPDRFIFTTIIKLSNYENVQIIFRYTTKDGENITLVSIDNFYPNYKETFIAAYFIKRIELGLPHNMNEIKNFSLN